MSLSQEGKIIHIGKQDQKTDNFTVQDVVISFGEGDHIQECVFQFWNKGLEEVEKVNEGDSVEIFFNLRGRLWEKAGQPKRWFNTLNGWKISTLEEAESPDISSATEMDDLDLPF